MENNLIGMFVYMFKRCYKLNSIILFKIKNFIELYFLVVFFLLLC